MLNQAVCFVCFCLFVLFCLFVCLLEVFGERKGKEKREEKKLKRVVSVYFVRVCQRQKIFYNTKTIKTKKTKSIILNASKKSKKISRTFANSRSRSLASLWRTPWPA